VVDAARAALAAGRDRYVPPLGLLTLREAIASYLESTRRLDTEPENIVVTPGCKMALALAMMALIQPGDEVLYPEPGFPIYPSLTRALGATPVYYSLLEHNRFQPDLEEMAAKITSKTRMLIFNSPNNPTGTVFSEAALHRIAELAVHHDLWVLADEIYARILFAGEYHSIHALSSMAERTVIIDGLSKSFAMTGWRIGYAVAPPPVVDALDLLIMNTFTCTAEFTQVAAIQALRDETHTVEAMVNEYRRRRDVFVAGLNRIPGFRCLSPEGAFYAWVNIEETRFTAEEIATLLLDGAGVAVIAGAAFGPSGKQFLRISLVAAGHLLEEALELIDHVSRRWRVNVSK
jgi:aspartate/methionine/tyrosine aminotransferase